MNYETKKEKKKVKISDILFGLLGTAVILAVVSAVVWFIGLVLVTIFAQTTYVSSTDNIYSMWQNKYYEEHNNGKTRTTEEINRYYYKTRVGNTYYDNWTTYDISDITVIDDNEPEHITIDRLHFMNDFFDKLYEVSSVDGDKPKTVAHYFIHEDTAENLGINTND